MGGEGEKDWHMQVLNSRKQQKHLQKGERQKPKRLFNVEFSLATTQTVDFGRLLVGYNRSHFLCSNRHINTIVCFLGMGLGCFSPPGGSSKLHNVACVELSDWKTQSRKPHRPPVGNSPMHTSLGNESGYFSPCPGSGHSDSSIQQRGGRLCPGLLYSCKWLMLEELLSGRFKGTKSTRSFPKSI